MIDKIILIGYRILFSLASIVMLIAVWDKILRMFGFTLSWINYEPWRLMEFSVFLLLFAIALLLRQIRDKEGK